MTDDVLDSIHCHNVSYKQFLKSLSKKNHLAYKLSCNETNRLIKQAKCSFFIKGAKQGSKSFWQSIKQCIGIGRMKWLVNPWPCASRSQTASSAAKLNKHFIDSVTHLTANACTLGTTQKATFQATISTTNLPAAFEFAQITTADVRRAITDLPAKSSHGEDDIISRMLRLSSDAISPYLATLFNASLDANIFPDAWKTAVVTPLYKKGDIYDMNNYRPILLLNLLGKIFEKIICVQISTYLENNELLIYPTWFSKTLVVRNCTITSKQFAVLRTS